MSRSGRTSAQRSRQSRAHGQKINCFLFLTRIRVFFSLLGLAQNSLVSLCCHIKKPKKHDCYFCFIFWGGEALILKGGAFFNVYICSLYYLHLCQLHSIQSLVARWSLLFLHVCSVVPNFSRRQGL